MPISYRAAQTLIKRGDEASLRTALQDGLAPDSSNQNGWTLLMLAAVEGNASLGKLLLESGANASLKNAKGDTAETLAEQKSFVAFVTMLRVPVTTDA